MAGALLIMRLLQKKHLQFCNLLFGVKQFRQNDLTYYDFGRTPLLVD